MNRAQKIALALTLLIAILLLIWLRFAKIYMSSEKPEWPPVHSGEVALVDEEFIDVIDFPPSFDNAADSPAPAFNEINADNLSDPAAESGSDLTDAGPAADAPRPVTSNQPSPVKSQTQPPVKTGPSQEEIDAKKTEEARRKATSAVNSAFSNSTGNNNTANSGTNPGNSGSPQGGTSGINGTGFGANGNGWIMPAYAKVPTSLTGSIRFVVKINRQGVVTDVRFDGGDAPAATDKSLRDAVEKEIRSRRFTRPSGSAAPDEAAGTITYVFR